MGEPLANYSRVVAAVERIIGRAAGRVRDPARSVTVSTVGLASAIRTLADEAARRHACAVAAHPPTTSCATPWCR